MAGAAGVKNIVSKKMACEKRVYRGGIEAANSSSVAIPA